MFLEYNASNKHNADVDSRSGNPTIVLPLWVDLYDYAIRTEWLGVGIWGSRKTAPFWTADELESAFMKILTKTKESTKMRARAKEVGAVTRKSGGRKMAAKIVVDYMNKGSSKFIESKPSKSMDREL